MPEGAGATTELSREHAAIERLVQRVASLRPCPERVELAREAAARFLSHARAEERYLLPAFRQYLPGGEREAVDQERQMSGMRAAAERIARTDEGDKDHEALVGGFVLDAQQHIERQETVLLPALLDACPQEEVNHIGRQMRYAMSAERGQGE